MIQFNKNNFIKNALRFRLSLRQSMLATAVIAVLVAMVAKENRRRIEQELAIAEIAKLGGDIGTETWRTQLPPEHRPVEAILLGGDDVTDEKIMRICVQINKLAEVDSLTLSRTKISNKSTNILKKIKQLIILDLRFNRGLTSACIEDLAELRNLKLLELSNTNINARDILKLKDLKNIEYIGLWDTPSTEDDLRFLIEQISQGDYWPNLRSILLPNCTDATHEMYKNLLRSRNINISDGLEFSFGRSPAPQTGLF